MYLIEAQVNEEKKLKSMCSFIMVCIEAKEDELAQLMEQKQGTSTNLDDWYRGKTDIGWRNWEIEKQAFNLCNMYRG